MSREKAKGTIVVNDGESRLGAFRPRQDAADVNSLELVGYRGDFPAEKAAFLGKGGTKKHQGQFAGGTLKGAEEVGEVEEAGARDSIVPNGKRGWRSQRIQIRLGAGIDGLHDVPLETVERHHEVRIRNRHQFAFQFRMLPDERHEECRRIGKRPGLEFDGQGKGA